MKTKKDIEIEVIGVHNLFWESYASRDIELRFSLCSEDVTFIGSGLHEKALNRTEYKKINIEGVKQFPDPFQIEFLWTKISMITEVVACVESEVVWSQLINNELSKELLRNTTLLKYDNSKWLVTHVHGSVPDYRLKEGDYMTNEHTIIRNRELERQVFERTQDLNRTLEELEQKNHDLEIESALEKVRFSALAMKEPADMVNVCNVISDQLQLLGVKDIRNIQTAVINEQKGTYLNYQYFTHYNKGVIEETEYNKHPKVLEMVLEMKKSVDAFFTGKFEGEDLNNFREYRKKDNQFSDPLLDEARIVHYNFYSIGLGGLGLTTYKILPQAGLEIFKRFHTVFSLAYKRFIDIERAEAQARESQIELALERVRARTMAMQKSEELKEVIRVVYEQFVLLKINVDHAGFVVDYTPKGNWHFWIADEQDIPSKITHPYFDSVWANQFNEAKKKGIDYFVTNLNFEEKNKFYNELLSYVSGLPQASKDFYLSCPGLAVSTVLFDNVSLYVENFSAIPYSDEETKILMRFGKVFQQTYTRFLDLERAEAQNKIIQAENDRKTKELEDARQLQLSMLPKELPQLPNLDIAVHMKTATEVGGDYYDFNIDSNGTITFVVGDATGHGMMSGMMVSVMKSFFISNKANIELKQFFENANNSIKDMHLGRLMMSFIGVQITSHKLMATNAGMPSLIYFRHKSQKAGEFISNNLPLGAMRGTKYLLKEIVYEKGDALLLMSDGFAELKNQNNEQYGYNRIKDQFRYLSHKSANEIIDELKNTASQWLNGAEPDDDISFVVIKIRQ